MTTYPSPDATSPSRSNGESPSSLPRWRQFLSMLNWRRDPDYEQRMMLSEQREILSEQRKILSEQRKMQHEWRMKQLENDILRVRRDSEQIKKETEQLRQENAKGRQLLARIDALCFPPESSSIPATATEPGSKPFSP